MQEETKEPEEYIVDFIKAFHKNEEEIKVYTEFRKDLKKNYIENGWLSKEEVALAIKAYRMMKKDEDFDELNDVYDLLKKKIGSVS